MKIFIAPVIALGLTIASTASANGAAAVFSQLAPSSGMPLNAQVSASQPVELPTQITETDSLAQYASELLAVQGAELVWLDAQTKYFEILHASFAGSRAMSEAFEAKAVRTGANVAAGTLTLVVDGFLAKAWLSGATPTYMVIKDIVSASSGNTSKMTAIGQKTYKSLLALGKSLKVPKNFVTTAAIGTFAYIQVENYFVINMSREQYDAHMAQLESKIASLVARKAAVADMHIPYSAR